jgi:hypothetical protein
LPARGTLLRLLASNRHVFMRALPLLPVDPADLAVIDAAVVERIGPGLSAPGLGIYLHRTGRTEWSEARAFLEGALRTRPGRASDLIATLCELRSRPPTSYVAALLEAHRVDEHAEKRIRTTFGLR